MFLTLVTLLINIINMAYQLITVLNLKFKPRLRVLKTLFNTFIQKNEAEKVKINQLVEIANELMIIINKSNQKT